MKQLKIPAAFIRGGTSNAVVFNVKDLPRDRHRHDNRQQRTPVVVQAEPVQAEEELIDQRKTPRAHGVAPGVPGRASSRRRIRA